MSPLDALREWRVLHDDRGRLIREARAADYSWREIQEATGLSRAAVAKIARG